MRVLVTGSRDWPDRLAVNRALNSVCNAYDLNYPPDQYGNTLPDPSKITVVEGGCPKGADAMAADWCLGAFFESEQHPADWEKHGKRAGFLRNAEMVELGADLCLAFIKDNSNGASMTLRMAMNAGIPTQVYLL